MCILHSQLQRFYLKARSCEVLLNGDKWCDRGCSFSVSLNFAMYNCDT